MEEDGARPEYNAKLTVKTPSGVTFDLDCGTVLRALDVLLYIAPREFREGVDWMLRLYESRRTIANAVDEEIDKQIEQTTSIPQDSDAPTGELF